MKLKTQERQHNPLKLHNIQEESQQTLGSVLSLCYQDDDDDGEDDIGEELTLVNLGFSVTKFLNWDGVHVPEKTSLYKALQYRITNYILPDCTVQIEDIEYRCHLLLLQCYSKFFERQKALKPVRLPSDQVEPRVFEFIYAWMLAENGDSYTMIRRDHIINLLIAAKYLEINELEQQCEDTIRCENFFVEGSAFILYLMARDRGLKDVQDMIVPKIRKFFLTIVSSLDFLEELKVEDVCNFLSSDYIYVHSELEVFMIGMRWLLHGWPARKPHVRDVMSCIRFGLIPPHHLVNIRRNTFCPLFNDVISSEHAVTKMMDDGVAYAIIKGWQAGEGEEFETCVSQQGLSKPKPRNWAERDKNCEYERYDQFLKELERRRRLVKSNQDDLSRDGIFSWSPQDVEIDIGEVDEECSMVELSLTQLGFKVSKYLDWKNVNGMKEKSSLYQNLKDRIRNYVNTDCIVLVGDEFEYNCHMLLLQCYSQFCSSIGEKRRIKLPSDKVSGRGFELTYQWMLAEKESAHLILRRDVLLEVYDAAQCLDVKELMALCWSTISNNKFFYEGTAFLLYLMGKERGMKDIQDLMAPRIGKFFLTLVSSRDFLDLDVNDVCAFLSSDNICVHSEVEVFMSAVRWLRHDWKRRKQYAPQVMGCIRFGLIPAWQLIDIRRNQDNPEFLDITSLPEIDEMIDNGLACSIVKEWYSEENEKYLRKLQEQGVTLPSLRNWYDLKKDYLTYSDFLRELNSRRKEHLEESRLQRLRILKSNRRTYRTESPTSIVSQIKDNQSQLDNRSVEKEKCEQAESTTIDSAKPSNEKLDIFNHLRESTNENILKHFRPLTPENQIVLKNFRSLENNSNLESKTLFMAPKDLKQQVSLTTTEADTGRLTAIEKQRGDDGVSPAVSRTVAAKQSFERLLPKQESSIIGPAQKGSVELSSEKHDSILIFGGTDPFQKFGIGKNNGRNIFRYDFERNQWDVVGELPQARHHHAVAVCRDRVYIVGGTDPSHKNAHGRSIVVSTVWSLDIKSRIWFRETDLTVARKDPGLVEVNGRILAIGGRDKSDKVLRSVEEYDPQTKKWSEAPPLNTARYAMGVAYHDNSVWVAGGTGRKGDTASVERLFLHNNRLVKKWVQQPPLRFPRGFCSLVSTGQDLYLVGGVHGNGGDRASVSDVDIWSGSEWKLRFSLVIPRHCQAVTMLGAEMIILGGVSTKYQSCLTDVQVYCCQRKLPLKTVKPLPQPLSGHGVVTLKKAESQPTHEILRLN